MHFWTTFNALFSGWWERALIRADENDRFLLCCIGSRIGALALRDVRETMRPLPVEPLAGAPPFVLGLATIRGFPTPVVDVGQLLGLSELPFTPALSASLARFVSLELGERTAALAVDAVLGVRSVPSGVLVNIPPLLQEACASVVSVVGALDARLLLVLEAARLVPASAWSAIEVPGAAA
jgi:purine-binding chemotaxis protein CheW